MKLNKILPNQILKLFALKIKSHEKKFSFDYLQLTHFLSSVKKSLCLILQFHLSGKKIMFIGLSDNFYQLVSDGSNHCVTSTNSDLKDFVSNGFSLSNLYQVGDTRFNTSPGSEFAKKIVTRPDLIVILRHRQQQMLLKECLRLKLPFIFYNSSLEIFEINSVSRTLNNEHSIHSSQLSFFETCLRFLLHFFSRHPAASSTTDGFEFSKPNKNINRKKKGYANK